MTANEPALRIRDDEPTPAEAAPDYRLQDQVGFLLRKAHQRHVAIFSSRIAELTPPQFAALAKLGEVGETSQNQLGTLVAMDAATVKGVIDRLRARGLVDVTKDAGDRRRVMVALTREGRTALGSLWPRARRITEETLSTLSARDAQQLIRLLGRIS